MKKHSYFTVVITAYNIEHYINDCIESIKNQTYSDFECIIVDDGSLDNSPKIIRDSIKDDYRFHLITISHGGPQKAKNAGLNKANGEFVIFVDGDDTLDLACLEDCKEKTVDSDLLIFGINYQQYESGKLVSEKPVNLKEMEFASGSELADWYIINQQLLLYSNANKFYRRETLINNNVHFNDEFSFGEDRLFNFDFLKVCNRICTLSGVYYNYRAINSSSLTHYFRFHHIDELLSLHKQKIDCLCNLSKKTNQSQKESFIKDDYDYTFDLAFNILKSNKNTLTKDEYEKELKYLEESYVPLPLKTPFYFYLDHAWMSKEKRAANFIEQIQTFKNSNAIKQLIEILDEVAEKKENIKRRIECKDDYMFLCQFKTRKGERQDTLQNPAAWQLEELLCDKKEQIYHLLFELGFIDNNKTLFDAYDYILIMGGANNANKSRTKKAKEIVDKFIGKGKKPKLIAGLSTNRNIGKDEYQVVKKYAPDVKYEFDVVSKCIENEFFIANGKMVNYVVSMEHNDIDSSFSSKIIKFNEEYKGCTIESYCAPKRNIDVVRADANDCLEFFLSNCNIKEGSTILLISSNSCCGCSFKADIGIEHKINLDIVGDGSNETLISHTEIRCFEYINELIKMYDELNKFETKYLGV